MHKTPHNLDTRKRIAESVRASWERRNTERIGAEASQLLRMLVAAERPNSEIAAVARIAATLGPPALRRANEKYLIAAEAGRRLAIKSYGTSEGSGPDGDGEPIPEPTEAIAQ